MNEKLERIRFTITTPGWTEDLLPDMQREINLALEILQRPQSERGQSQYSDDFLRGYLRGIKYTTHRPAQLMTESDSDAERAKVSDADANASNQTLGSPYARQDGPESA